MSNPREQAAREQAARERPPRLVAIGDAARSVGISAFRIRWYADRGMLGPVARSEGNLRRLTPEQVALLGEIAAWRRHGLNLREIDALLGARRGEAAGLRARLRDAAREVAQRARAVGVMADALD